LPKLYFGIEKLFLTSLKLFLAKLYKKNEKQPFCKKKVKKQQNKEFEKRKKRKKRAFQFYTLRHAFFI